MIDPESSVSVASPDSPSSDTRSPALNPKRGSSVSSQRRPSSYSTPSNSSGDSPPRARLGRYELIQRLGQGAQGEVWKAIELGSEQRLVAVKLLARGLGRDSARIRQFHKEVDRQKRLASSSLSSKRSDFFLGKGATASILPLLDSGEEDGIAYLVMPYIEGWTLAQIIEQRWCHKRGQIPVESHRLALLPEWEYRREMAGLLARLARALHVCHQARLAHRDVKPSNILLARDPLPLPTRNGTGTPSSSTTSRDPTTAPAQAIYLADFGLARDLDDVSLDPERDALGTPAYMAQEKLEGREGIDEIKADIASLGLTAFETFTLAKPRQLPVGLRLRGSQRLATLAALTMKPPRAICPDLPRHLEVILQEAIDPDPNHRYATALEFADDLERWLHGQPPRALARRRFDRQCLRNLQRRAVKLTLFLLVLLLVVISIAIGWSIRNRHFAQLAFNRAQTAFEQGDLECVRIELEQAEALGLESERLVAFLVRVRPELFAQTEKATASGEREWLERAKLWTGLLQRQLPVAGQRFDALLNRRVFLISSEPPGAVVTFRLAWSNGEPRAVAPVARLKAGSSSQPTTIDSLLPGDYWVTAIDPATGGFSERPWTIPFNPRDNHLHLPVFDHDQLNLDLVRFPGGPLPSTSSPSSANPSGTVSSAEQSVRPFRLSPHEITYREFRRIQTALGQPNLLTWRGDQPPPPDWLDYPVTRLTYQEALEFACLVGCRLPTLEELAFAQGGIDCLQQHDPNRFQRLLARGAIPDPVNSSADDRTETPGPYPRRLSGLFGNVSEFTLHPSRGDLDPTTGLIIPGTQGHVVSAGLIRLSPHRPVELVAGLRGKVLPKGGRNPLVGFRLARSETPRFPLTEAP